MIAALDLKDASGLRAEECSEKWAPVPAAQAQARAAQAQAQDRSPIRRPRVPDWPRRFRSQAWRPAEWEWSACASAHRA